MTTFFVPGIPAPQGSKRHVGGGVMIESSKRLKPWRKRVNEAANEHRSRDAAVYPDQAVSVDLEFILPRPKYAVGKILPAVKRVGDIDKLSRSILDSLTGVCFGDDAQVTDLHASKRLADPGETVGVYITYVLDRSHETRAEVTA